MNANNWQNKITNFQQRSEHESSTVITYIFHALNVRFHLAYSQLLIKIQWTSTTTNYTYFIPVMKILWNETVNSKARNICAVHYTHSCLHSSLFSFSHFSYESFRQLQQPFYIIWFSWNKIEINSQRTDLKLVNSICLPGRKMNRQTNISKFPIPKEETRNDINLDATKPKSLPMIFKYNFEIEFINYNVTTLEYERYWINCIEIALNIWYD